MTPTDRTRSASPSRRRRRNGFWLVAAVYALVMLGGTLPVPLYTFWGSKFGFGAFTTTLIFAAYALGTVVALLFLASLSDHVGRRPMLLVALGTAVVSTILFLTAGDVAVLLVARFVFGLSTGVFTATATATLAELAGPDRPRLASTVATAANAGGLGLGAFLAGVVAQTTTDPTHVVFLIYLVALAPAVAAILVTPETVADRHRPEAWIRRLNVPEDGADRREFLGAAITVLAAFVVAGFFSSLVPSFLRDGLHLDNHAFIGAEVALFFLAALLTQTSAPPRLAVSAVIPPVGLALGVVAFQAGLLTRWAPLFVVGTVLAGGAFGLILRSGVMITDRLADPDHRADLLATFFLCAYAGNIVPTVALGALEQVMSTDVATTILATVVVLLTVVAVVARRPRPNTAPSKEHASTENAS
ncbi:MAG TPA: MFS transporter [Pseudonocardia sp.]